MAHTKISSSASSNSLTSARETVTSNSGTQPAYALQIRFEPYFVPYYTHEDFAILPQQFNRDHIDEVSDHVFLCDPVGNLFHVRIQKINGQAVFVQGWKEIGNYYGLKLGGWARLVYVRSDRFLINMRDRLDQEVIYPTPKKVLWLGETPKLLKSLIGDCEPSHMATLCQKPDLFHVLEKTLTLADLITGRLHIPFDFCNIAFKRSGIRVVLFDEVGLEISCSLQFHRGCPGFCGIADGWFSFSRVKGLTPGISVQLAVPSTNPNMLLFKRLPN